MRDLLKAGKWKEADEETLVVMLKAASRQQKRWLDPESVNNLPTTDLRTIDQLWVKYSNGRFGFSVQKRIWESVGENYDKFGDRVGWRRYKTLRIEKNIIESLENINQRLGFKQEAVTKTGAEWLHHTDLTLETHAPQGHFPATVGLGEGSNDFGGGWVCVPALLSRRDLPKFNI